MSFFVYLSPFAVFRCLSLSPLSIYLSVSLPRLVTRKRSAREYVITLYGASIYARVSLSSSRHRQFKIKREHLPRASLRRLRRDRPYIPKPRNVEGVRGFASRSPLWRTFFFYSFSSPSSSSSLSTLSPRNANLSLERKSVTREKLSFETRARDTTKKEISKDQHAASTHD